MSERIAAALAGHCRIERELGQGGMATVATSCRPRSRAAYTLEHEP